MLSAGGLVSQAAGTLISGERLWVSGVGTVGTAAAPLRMAVETLAGRLTAPGGGGGIFLVEQDGLSIGTVDGRSDLAAEGGGAVVLRTLAGDLGLAAEIRTGSGRIALEAPGSITAEVPEGIVRTTVAGSGSLALSAGGSIGTTAAALKTDVAALAAELSPGSPGGIFLQQTAGSVHAQLAVSQLTGADGVPIDGISVPSAQPIQLTVDSGDLLLARPITTGEGVVFLDISGEILQGAAGRLSAEVPGGGRLGASWPADRSAARATRWRSTSRWCAAASQGGGGIFLNQIDGVQGDLTVGSVDRPDGTGTLRGLSTSAGTIEVTVSAGGLSVTEAIASSGGPIGLTTGPGDAGVLRLSGAGRIDSGGGIVVLRADDLAIDAPAAGRIDSGSGRLTLAPRSDGRAIDLGSDTPGRLGVSAGELGAFSTTGVLQIGSAGAGTIS